MAGNMPIKAAEKKVFDELISIMKTQEGGRALENIAYKIQKNRKLLRWVDQKDGYTAFQAGIIAKASTEKITTLLAADPTLAQQRLQGRLPLHLALEHHPREDIILKLINEYEDALREPDYTVDGRLALHMILESQPFPANFIELGMKVLDKYEKAASVTSHERYPLQVCIENGLQPRLTLRVLEAYRAAAAVPTKEGKFPLHVAVENNADPRIITFLVDAFPGALMTKMATSVTEMTVLEYAIRNRLGEPVLRALMDGGHEEDPRAVAYARAATIGKLTKEARLEYAPRIREDLQMDTETLARQRKQIKFKVKPDVGEEMEFEMFLEEKVEALKQRIHQTEGTPEDRMRLTLDRKQLMDGFDLAHYCVTKGCVIILQLRFEILQHALRNQASKEITLKLLELRPQAAEEDDRHGVLPLQLAIQNLADESVVLKLIEKNRRAVKKEISGGAVGEYPLHMALKNLRKYSKEVIKQLLQDSEPDDWTHIDRQGRRVQTGAYCPGTDTSDPQCKLPMHIAVQDLGGMGEDEFDIDMMASKAKDVIAELISKRCPIGARDPVTGQSALDICLSLQHIPVDLFQYVYDEVSQTNPKVCEEAGANGQRPLHVAVVHNANPAIIEMLCRQGPDALMSFDIDGRLPLHLAVSCQAGFSAVRTLLKHMKKEHGLRAISVTDGQGRTPLQLAATHHAAPGVVFEITREDKTTLHARDSRGRSVIELAVAHDAPQWVIQELLEASPGDDLHLNLLSGKWPNTKASAEALRFAFEARRRNQRGGANPGNNMNSRMNSSSGFNTGSRLSGQQTQSRGDLGDNAPKQRTGTFAENSENARSSQEDSGTLSDATAMIGRWFGW